MVGSDYPATHSTSRDLPGRGPGAADHHRLLQRQQLPEHHSGGGFFGPPSAFDPTGDTCADAAGNAESCSTAGRRPRRRRARDPAARPPAARSCRRWPTARSRCRCSTRRWRTMLYQEQRFGMLGCDQTPVAASCTNPGGINGDRSGNALLPAGPAHGATPTADLGTKNGDAAVVEKESEEGAVLLKNDASALPITTQRPAAAGPGHRPRRRVHDRRPDRRGLGRLRRPRRDQPAGAAARRSAGNPGAFTYVPANAPSGEPVPSSALSDSTTSVTGPSTAPPGRARRRPIRRSTSPPSSGNGQLAPGNYTWTGYVYVPATDTYTFRFQFSSARARRQRDLRPRRRDPDAEHGRRTSTATASPARTAPRCRARPTDAGYTQAGLTNVADRRRPA